MQRTKNILHLQNLWNHSALASNSEEEEEEFRKRRRERSGCLSSRRQMFGLRSKSFERRMGPRERLVFKLIKQNGKFDMSNDYSCVGGVGEVSDFPKTACCEE